MLISELGLCAAMAAHEERVAPGEICGKQRLLHIVVNVKLVVSILH